jgi:tetratricopeptide (TPR) repeat protein
VGAPRLPIALLAGWLALVLPSAAPAADVPAAADAPAAFLRAGVLADEGRPEEALAELDAVATLAPSDPYVEIVRAGLLMRLGRLDEATAAARHARELAPDEPEALRLLGRIGLMRADADSQAAAVAIEAFESLRRLQPEDLEALVSLGQLYLGAGHPELAADALAEAGRLRPGHPGIESLLARALDQTADAGQAERIERERLERAPGDLAPRLELADLLGRQGRHEEAVAVLDQAPAGQRAALEVRRRLGLQLLLSGDLARAREVASAVVDQWPDYGGGRLLLARIEAAYGQFAEAEAVLVPLLGAEPLPDVVADLQVRLLEGMGKIEEAAAQMESDRRRLADQGRSAEADRFSIDLARLWFRHQRWTEAVTAARAAAASADADTAGDGALLAAAALDRAGRWDEALAQLGPSDPARPLFAARRIGVLVDAGRDGDAEAEIERLLAARPEADLEIGAALADREQWRRAIPLLESAAKREPASVEATFRLAVAYERSARTPEAVELFQRLIAQAPDFSPALNYLGYFWIDRGENLERGLELVGRAARLDPDNGAYVDSLGWGLFRLGRNTEALESLERAARLLPDDATVLEHLGDVRLANGDRKRAAEAYRRAIASAPPGQADAASRKLEALRGSS